MPDVLPGDWVERVQKINQTKPWVWLYEFEVDSAEAARTKFRVHGYNAEVTFDAGDGGGPQVYYPVPMRQGPKNVNMQGNLPAMDVTFSNVARIAGRYLFLGDGFIGHPAKVYLLNLYDTSFFKAHTFEVVSAAVDTKGCVLRVGPPAWWDRLVPQDRFNARRCRHLYARGPGSRCPMILTAAAVAAGLENCGKAFGDCRVRADFMRTHNLGDFLLRYFGGFLGIPQS